MSKHIFWKTNKPKARRTQTVICSCGTRYIKTRDGQTMCIWCLAKADKKVQ